MKKDLKLNKITNAKEAHTWDARLPCDVRFSFEVEVDAKMFLRLNFNFAPFPGLVWTGLEHVIV